MTPYRRTILILLLCSATAWLPAADPPRPISKSAGNKTVRVLGVGNSFTHDATTFLAKLAAEDGHTLILTTATVGGSPLQTHWEKAQIHEREPKNPDGLYSGGRSLKQLLRDGKPDFVTLQQRSALSHDPSTYRPYAAQLQAFVKEHAPRAELLLHQTWAYRVDDRRFRAATPLPGEPRTRLEMHEGLSRAYRLIAAELDLRLIPVGDAFHAADSDPQWGFRPDPDFDARTASPPALPDQSRSLHVGLKWNLTGPGAPSLSMDGHHASTAGRYLGACVWYEVFFETDCTGNAFTAGLDPEYARFLQATAHRAVEKSR